jgi:hypothetical protein
LCGSDVVAAVVNYGGRGRRHGVHRRQGDQVGGELIGVDYARLAREGEASRTCRLERFGVTTDEMRAGL